MSKSFSNSSSRSLRDKINELESEIQNIKEIFKYFFSNFPEYEENDKVPVLENSDIVVGRIKKELKRKPEQVKVKVLRSGPKGIFSISRFTRKKKRESKRTEV